VLRPDRPKRTGHHLWCWFVDSLTQVRIRNAVMPLDVLGRTRATLTKPASVAAVRSFQRVTHRSPPWPEGPGNLVKLCRAGDSPLQLLDLNEEFLVSASHQLALITSLPFYYCTGGQKWVRKDSASQPVLITYMATLSNCGNTLKLSLPSWTRKRSNGQGNDLGYGNNEKDAQQWAIRSEVLTSLCACICYAHS
jgi:hypothetical protein